MFDWLGTRNGLGGDKPNLVPSRGTVFPYVDYNKQIYKCPQDKLDPRAEQNGNLRQKVVYSYTAPSILTGAPIPLLKSTLWPVDFPSNYKWQKDWQTYAKTSLPWMILEEDEAWYLNFVTDSAWSNDDGLADRHDGRANIAHTDAGASARGRTSAHHVG